MGSKYDGLAKVIVQNVGGKENIQSLSHCVSRLRFQLFDNKKAQTDILDETDGVVKVIQSGGQYQVVIGTHVTDVFQAVVQAAGISTKSESDQQENEAEQLKDKTIGAKAKGLFTSFVSTVTGIFAPWLGVLSAMRLLKGLLSIFVTAGILVNGSPTYNVLFSLADAFFFFMPIMLAYTAAKKFGLSQTTAILLGVALLYPNMLSSSEIDVSSVFSLPVIMPASGDYSTSVVPIILAVWFASKIEKAIKDKIPETIKLFTVPFIVLVITYLATILIIGPIASAMAGVIGNACVAIYEFNPILLGAIVGFAWQILVMFGLHWAILPIAIANLFTMGFERLLVGTFACTFAQVGAVLAIYLKTKNKKLKSLCIPAIASGIVGVTEPAIYGITLPKKKPFIITCIIGGLCGASLMFTGVTAYSLAGNGVFGYTAYINTATNDVSGMIAAIVISIASIIASFIAVYLMYSEESVKEG